jgi:hypothetical protein
MPHVRITRAIAAAIASTLIASVYMSLAAASASAVVTLHVCRSGCAFSQIAPAIAAAKSGDTVEVAAGTYKGGLAIDVSVKLVGAGAHATTIRGGGPVVTIDAPGGVSEPTVSITGVTITGGVTRSSPQSEPMTGKVGVIAAGGGVEIAPRATVAISHSAIVDNRVAPLRAVAQGPPCPGGVRCPYAQAEGGGIDDSGQLTLTDTTISNNRVGAAAGLSNVASDADGGAINLNEGALTIINSTISDNTASATAPNGRYADSGAIDAVMGTVTIRNSSLTNNSAALAAAEPNSVAANGGAGAGSGAIHVQSNVSATISNTKISGNSARTTNTLGDADADSGGVHADVDLKLTGDVFADNRVYAATLAGSSGDAEGDSGAGELSGTISDTRFAGNAVTVRSANGNASGSSGATLFGPGSISNSVIQANHVHVASPGGTTSAVGGGIETGSSFAPGEAAPQTLTNTPVSENTAEATGRSGTARGGGIFDKKVPNGPPGGPLTLIKSMVTHNKLSGSAGITLQGGGVFATFKLTLTDSAVTANTPDECAGTAC